MIGAQNAGKSSLLNAMRRTTGKRSQQTMDESHSSAVAGHHAWVRLVAALNCSCASVLPG